VTNRVGTSKQAAEHFGFITNDGLPNVRAFLSWARENKVRPAHGKVHHLWWNFKVIESVLEMPLQDKIESSKPDFDTILNKRLKHGKNTRQISAHS
jgi:hypothetical protein